ncbi:hypothetical protein CL616_04200 [archaeon]|jgi:site-specific DNA recombinase|nr:hypothetical protein [archaeon]|tara:strand:+ start:127 stop:825 length:699 start_codon:yes stop_codon:yes gene_type:complete
MIKSNKTIRRVVGYVRVSSPGQALNGVSVDNQKQTIIDYCNKNDYELIDMIEDLGKSGRTANRIGYQTLKIMIENKAMDGVVVYSISRVGRSVVETSKFLDEMVKNDVKLIGALENYDISSANGRMIVQIHSIISENESIQMSERIRDALQYKKSIGKAYNSNTMYGWRREGDDLIKDDEEVRQIRRIKNFRSRGWSWYKIAKKFNEEGVKTKKGGKWYNFGVKNVYGYYYG